ncbi:MAG: HypC/HybG/HupF family hydrogenase formation chaperone [Nitrososphaerota archaeon]|nr:HypC/HybG/HupF family hydrogenase formation chaperone [Candidatus Calditenuaceae archaeon]MDW8072852.1 HypC/HybG/HupF family hydrogenase formation chaperone [Nitrososphaerota archaeon]
MCLGVYGRVLKTDGELAVVDFGGGLIKDVLVSVEDVREGDYVVVHAGVIVSKLSEKDFMEVFNHIEEAVLKLAQSNIDASSYLERIRSRLAESLSPKIGTQDR